MQFDAKAFYDELDGYYSRYDNEATEKFLLDYLNNVENSVLITPGCSCCGDGECSTGECGTEACAIPDNEREWLVARSQGMIAVLNELACFYRGISKWPECIDTFHHLRKEMEDCALTETDNYALVILNLAGAYRLMGKYDEALAAFDDAGKILEKNGKNDAYSIASLLNNTGLVHQDKKDYAKAAECFEKALELMHTIPDNDAEIATSLNNLAMAYHGIGDEGKAMKALDESLAIFKDLDGGMNPHYAGGLNTKALFLFNSGNFAGAAALFEQAVEKTKLIFGENKEYAIGCRNCAYAYSKLGDKDMAQKYSDMAAAAETKLPKA